MLHIDKSTWDFLVHTLVNCVVVIVVLAAAIAVDMVEHWCVARHTSPWLCVGISWLARFLFVADAFVFGALVIITGVHLIKSTYQRAFVPVETSTPEAGE